MPSLEQTRALWQCLLTPVRVPVHSMGGYAVYAATPVHLLSLRDVLVTSFLFPSLSVKL